MAELSFTIPIEPRGQARAKSRALRTKEGRIMAVTYKDGKQRREEGKLAALIAPHCPPVPFAGPLTLEVTAYFPTPTAWSRRKKAEALAGNIAYVKKPDLDNIVKHLKDVMSGMVYRDDRQIVGLAATKHYGDPPRWVVTVREVAA